MQQEEEAKTSQGGNNNNKSNSHQGGQNNAHHVTKWKQETGDEGQYGEYIDMDMDEECVSDVDSET